MSDLAVVTAAVPFSAVAVVYVTAEQDEAAMGRRLAAAAAAIRAAIQG